ncbi:hypothetical protein GNO49_22735 [Escherichia coli]|uniref:hypothetical protein n=1 Tax=Escherichia coli TaxID=562 RepID=UPI0016A49CD4|nr:hypothetical protein [Escherichia coli]EFH6938966.1 hypothetical protein [Escherichia coli]EFH6972230.1 hypothetical protein [Escherichia coli]EFJ0001846.1 hypothetical protein [Escherichia coli]EFN2288477.1 hypothetical protein [Escherichia coli]
MGSFDSEDSEIVQEVMLIAVESRFSSGLLTSPVEWLTGNVSYYRAHETHRFARMVVKDSCVEPGEQQNIKKLRENDEA